MNYFERLSRRAFAQPATGTGSVYDPFSETVVDAPEWPVTETGVRADHDLPRKVDAPGKTEIIKDNRAEDQEAVTETQVRPAEPRIQEATPPNNPDKGQEVERSDSSDQTEDVDILNKTEGISLIDQIMAPHIEAATPSALEALEQQRRPSHESDEPAAETSRRQVRVEPADNTGKRENLASTAKKEIAPEPPREPRRPASRRSSPASTADETQISRASSQEAWSDKPQYRDTSSHEHHYVLLKQNSWSEDDRKEATSGSPRIGIGQL